LTKVVAAGSKFNCLTSTFLSNPLVAKRDGACGIYHETVPTLRELLTHFIKSVSQDFLGT